MDGKWMENLHEFPIISHRKEKEVRVGILPRSNRISMETLWLCQNSELERSTIFKFGKSTISMGIIYSTAIWTYPLVNIQKAIENGHRNSEFSHNKW